MRLLWINPQAAKEDQRVLYTDFRADEVYPVTAASGIITTIVFSPSEQVQSYGSGFSTAWEFLSRGNYFFLKPKATDGRTNLVVVTNRRSYLFDIRLGSRAKATYRLTFRYPLDEIEAAKKEAEKNQVKSLLSDSALHSEEKDPENKKSNYQYTMNFGSAAASKTIAPIKAFDDNRFTYLKFKEQTDFPGSLPRTGRRGNLAELPCGGRLACSARRLRRSEIKSGQSRCRHLQRKLSGRRSLG